MSSKIKFDDKLILSNSHSLNASYAFLTVNQNGQLIISSINTSTPAYTGVTTGGLIVSGIESSFLGNVSTQGNVNISSSLNVDSTSTFNDLVTITKPESNALLIFGDVIVNGNFSVNGNSGSSTTGQVTIADNIFVINNDDVGPGVSSGYSGFTIRRGIPVGQENSQGESGQGQLPSASIMWDDSNALWDLNYAITQGSTPLASNPRIRNVGAPTQATDASTKKYVDDELLNALNNLIYLDRLTDVQLSGTSDKQILQYNSSISQWTNTDYKFIRLTDVAGTSVPNGYLRWNSAGTSLIYQTTIDYAVLTGLSAVAKSGQGTLDYLDDVVITSPATAHTLRYNGTNWVNILPSYTDLTNKPTSNDWQFTGLQQTDDTAIANGYLRWNSTGTSVSYQPTIDYAVLTGLSAVAKSGQGTLDYLDDVVITTPATSQVIKYNGTNWVNSVLSFTELSNTPTNNSYSFAGLNDTDNSIVNNGFLRWNSNGTLISYQATIDYVDLTGLSAVAKSGQGTLDYLDDVVITTPSAAQVIKFNGTNWVNTTLSYLELSNTPTSNSWTFTGLQQTTDTPLANGYLRWNSAGNNIIYTTSIDVSSLTGISAIATLGQATIDNIENVSVTSVSNNDVLYYNTASSKWINGQLSVSAVSGAVPNTRTINTGVGLSGGDDLTGDITLSVVSDNQYGIEIDPTNGIGIYRTVTDTWYAPVVHTHTPSQVGLSSISNNGNTITGDTTIQGNLVATGDGSFNTSDVRLKDNIVAMSDSLSKLKEISGYKYRRTDTGVFQYGLLAQEIEKILPESVIEVDDLKRLNYNSVIALLVNAVKELSDEVEYLKSKK